MKTTYRFIRFEQQSKSSEHSVWDCLNKKHGDSLGVTEWDNGWNQYVFSPDYAIFSADCLDDISHFLKQLNAEER